MTKNPRLAAGQGDSAGRRADYVPPDKPRTHGTMLVIAAAAAFTMNPDGRLHTPPAQGHQAQQTANPS